MRALRDRWTLTSRLYDRADEGQPRKKVLDASIGWQNYQDAYGDYYPAEPGYSEPDGDGYSARFTRLPRLVRLGNDGKKRVYPVPGNDQAWIELAKPQEITLGQPTSKVGGVWTWDRPAYTFTLKVGPSGVKFSLVLKRAVGVNTLTLPFTAQGLTRQGNLLLANGQVVAALRRPTVRWPGMSAEQELNPPAVDVAFVGGAIVLSFDLTGLPYPIEIDPPIDLQVAASLDDVHERESTGVVSNSATVITYSSNTSNSGRYWAGLRWVNSDLTLGDTIDVAYFETYIYNASFDDPNMNIHFEKAAGPAQFATTDFNVTGRTRTTASAPWVQVGTGVGWMGSAISLVTPLQEVVDAYSPTAIAVLTRPNSDANYFCFAYPWDYDDNTWGPKLHVEFTSGGVGRIMGALAGHGGLAGAGGIAGRRGGIAG